MRTDTAMAATLCFYAYSSHNLTTDFLIKAAIHLINDSHHDVSITDWSTMPNSGKYVIAEICNEIDDSEVFICDLTDLNPNVLFEFGYAIATDKRVWVTRAANKEWNDTFYAELGFLQSIGYTTYNDAIDIQKGFFSDKPYEDIEKTLFKEKIKPLRAEVREPKLLFLKSPDESEDSNSVHRILLKSQYKDSLLVDDPSEIGNRSLEWYIESLLSAFAVIAHFDSQSNVNKNSKHALLCGMAYGINKRPLMLAQEPYVPAFDYKDMMYRYSNSQQRDEKLTAWMDTRDTDFAAQQRKFRRYQRRQEKENARQALRNIQIGDYEAESEKEQLANYFIETPSFYNAVSATQYIIFSGKKGSGKTANFYEIAKYLRGQTDKKNHVCVIKPLPYDLKGVYELYRLTLADAEKTHLVESLWKYLIYTELAQDVYKSLVSKPEQTLTEQEHDLISFVDAQAFMKEDFTIRLDRMLRTLYQNPIDIQKSIKEQRDSFSNLLHDAVIHHLRILLGRVLTSFDGVIILIDNLDKQWEKTDDFKTLSSFLFGLLNIVERIGIEFQKEDSKQSPVPLRLIVFIRSDIVSVMRKYAPEKDKFRVTLINWNETLLLRLIEARFLSIAGLDEEESNIWEEYFPRTIYNTPIKRYLVQSVLPRARDMIYLCKQALLSAKSLGHTKIEVIDIQEGQNSYSNHIYTTLLEETRAAHKDMEAILRKFMNATEYVTRQTIEHFLQEVGVDDTEYANIIDALVDANLLGYEVEPGRFEFIYDDRKEDRREQFDKVIDSTGIEQYRINRPFHNHFEIVANT